MAEITPPDDLLIERAKKNNESALNEIIIWCSSYVLNLCQKWCRPPLESEDVTQNALIKIAKNIKQYRFESKFSTWVYSLSYNVFLDEYRKNARRNKILEQNTSPANSEEKLDDNNENIEILYEVIPKLSEEHQQILIMIDVEEYSYKDASQMLNIEVGTVRSRLSRARIALKNELNNNGTFKASYGVKEGKN